MKISLDKSWSKIMIIDE